MSDGLTPAQLDEIEATAKKAGDEVSWAVETRGIEVRIPEVISHQGLLDPDDAAHIAMMDPATTLALVAEVRELRAKVERVRELHRENAYPDRPVSRCRDCDDVWPCETARALGEEA